MKRFPWTFPVAVMLQGAQHSQHVSPSCMQHALCHTAGVCHTSAVRQQPVCCPVSHTHVAGEAVCKASGPGLEGYIQMGQELGGALGPKGVAWRGDGGRRNVPSEGCPGVQQLSCKCKQTQPHTCFCPSGLLASISDEGLPHVWCFASISRRAACLQLTQSNLIACMHEPKARLHHGPPTSLDVAHTHQQVAIWGDSDVVDAICMPQASQLTQETRLLCVAERLEAVQLPQALQHTQ